MDIELTVGGTSKGELVGLLKSHGVRLNEYAEMLLANDGFNVSQNPYTLLLRSVSLEDIGLPGGGTYAEIVAAAIPHGLVECPLEAAPHLRLAHRDQPIGPYLTVASPEPRPGTTFPNGFYLRHLDDGLWLRGYESGPENIYAADFSDFVFAVTD